MTDPRAQTAPPAKAPRRLRRWLKRLVIVLLSLGALAVIAWQALTSSWFLAPRIESMLSSLIGGNVTIRTAELDLHGHLHLTDVRLLVPSIKGPAGELVHVPDVSMNLDRDELLAGRFTVQGLTIDDALLRLSEDLDSGRFNVGGLTIPAPTGASPSMVWPRVELRSGVVQIGEHRDGRFYPSGELRVNGSLKPEKSPRGSALPEWYSFDLEEIPVQGLSSPSAMQIAGRFNIATTEGSCILSGVTFEPERAQLLPRVARQWWNAIDPSGSLEPIAFQLDSDGRYEVEIAMDGIDWSLPVPSFDPQRDTNAPRMTDVHGSVVIHDGIVDLIGLSGAIDGVRYGLAGSFASVDRSPGFDLTFQVERFDLSRNLNLLTALPISVRRLVDNQLIQLGGPTGLLDAHVTLTRAPAGEDASGGEAGRPVRASGRVELLNAEGSYSAFPYPLTGLNGAVEFDDDEIRVIALAGRGPSGGQIFVSGTIAPPLNDPLVNIELYAINVPVDDHLRRALGERRGGALDEFFNEDWARRLHDDELFLQMDDVQPLSDEVMTLMREYRELSGPEGQPLDAASRQRQDVIRGRMESIEQVLKRPTFELGGRINIRSTVRRDRGPGEPTRVSNLISLSDPAAPLGIVYDEFPYPVRLISGEILIGYDRIDVVKDLVVEGLSGARGVINGYVDRVRVPERRQEPHLTIRAAHLPIDTYLLRAIPDADWKNLDPASTPLLSKGARVVAGLRLAGQLSADGAITTDERGKAAFDIKVSAADTASLDAGERVPYESELEWTWPTSLPLSHVQANLTVHRRSVEINEFSGVSDAQQFRADGTVDWSSGQAAIELHVDGENIDLKPHLIDLASAIGQDGGVQEMQRFWDRFQPQGTADAALTYTQANDGATGFDLRLVPRAGSVLISEHRVAIANPIGSLHFVPGSVTFDALRADATSGGVNAGHIALDGPLAWAPTLATSLDAQIEGGSLEAPVYAMFSEGVSRLFAGAKPDAVSASGVFDASLKYSRPAGAERPDYVVNLRPRTLDLSLSGERFELRRIEGSAIISPEAVQMSNLFGAYQDGLIHLDGVVKRGSGIDAALRLSVSSQTITNRVRVLLPRAANQLIDAIDLEVGQSVELSDAEIHYTRQPQQDAQQAPLESLSFDGLLNVRDASANLSIPITELDGSLHLKVQRRSDEPWLHGEVSMTVPRMLVLGRLVTGVRADLTAGTQPGVIEMPRLTGDCYGGRVSAEGWLRVPWKGEPGQYELNLALAQVAVAPVLRRYPTASVEANGDAGASSTPPPPTARPGRLEASLSIAGQFGEARSRIGRGVIRVRDAELYDVPLAMWALQLSALTLPVSTSFREAEIECFVEGSEVVFERLVLDSPSMSLVGRGVLNYETKALDMRFNTASKLRAPLLTPLWEALRDLFMSIHVTGTLERPHARLEAHADRAVSAARPAGAASAREGTAIVRPRPE